MINFHVLSIFPNAMDSYLEESILKRAQKEKKIKVNIYNPRDFSTDKHKKVDAKPYGGGPGMIMQVEPLAKTIKKILGKIKDKKTIKIIIFSPSGKKFTNLDAKKYSKYKNLILICGRYEGIDARVKKIFSAKGGSASGGKVEEISIGDYILTGGEIPAMVVIDSVSRQIPGVLGNLESIEENRTSSSEMYTRPEVFKFDKKKWIVPKILLSGNHKNIEKWRENKKTIK
ncbi:MAG: tRNA (guanine37-N1)-methyltransferase [Parcubacteria group bacterium Athens0714_16]|nr:MAG: tRNA (guanine37-N1)-methyltransferase [Parcubacteria group bacterium Athens0714_16]